MTDATLAPATPDANTRTAPLLVTWLTWPALFIGVVAGIAYAIRSGMDLGLALGVLTGVPIVTLVTLEFIYPLDRRWRMTWRSFFGRDIKYFIAGGLSGTATNFLLGLAGMSLAAGHTGPLTHLPLWLAIPLAILLFDFCQYWQHRWSHEADTAWKRFLWKTHAPHHLPEQVYVLMHPAGHPLNFFLLQGLIRVPLFYALGVSPEALFGATAIIGLQGIVSHCNVDLRAGWFNYIFAGTELHRYHHSANVKEGQNYAVALSLLDLLFGTFVYRPGSLPANLGVGDPAAYPRASQFWRVMLIPFRS